MAGKPQKKKKLEPAQEGSGRPSLFTKARRDAIIDDIAHRIPYIMAAEANGICEETLYAWLRQGIADRANNIDSEYAIFSEDIKRTEKDKMRHHLDKIDQNVDRWQADAWILERRWYKLFGANVPLNELNARMDKLEKDEANARKLHSAQGEDKEATEE